MTEETVDQKLARLAKIDEVLRGRAIKSNEESDFACDRTHWIISYRPQYLVMMSHQEMCVQARQHFQKIGDSIMAAWRKANEQDADSP